MWTWGYLIIVSKHRLNKLSYILVSLKKNRGCSSNFIQIQWELRPIHANEVRVVHLTDVKPGLNSTSVCFWNTSPQQVILILCMW